ncbi:hypothetical protein Tco_1175559, partial [Tanacetum coccineum]
QVFDLEKAKDAQAKEIADLKKKVQRLERKKKSRTTGFKRLKKVVDDTQERSDDADMFDIDDLHGDEVNVDMPVGKIQEQSVKEREVDTNVEGSAAPTTIEEITLAQTLIQIKAAKPKVVTTAATTTITTRPKARGVVVQEPTMMEADFELDQKLQIKEQGEITIKERSRLFVELIKKIKKHFAMLRAEEKGRKPPTKAQKRNLMSTYLKNMGRYKQNQLKSKSYEEIQKMFDNEMRRINTFIPMDSERQRIKDDKETDEHEEVEVDDEVELKNHMVIVKDYDIAIDAIPLATKPPVIVEYKLLKQGILVHYQLIRADGSSKRYSSMIRVLQDINREDLETLWKLVKTKHGDTRPEDEHERVLWGDLKVMFEPDIKSDVWRNL